ncbi:N-alpha-acetyltransferase 80 isoform X2 [Cryptotermes secundus]|uniref:N-alpha-acetyltransferase 80 isoform X2 n=1 Tax=Cryptotermes secundus TaxID=105785 RepID=UPI000CD7AB18|nr:N-alpha-acetyltransferase 80 isoform X2 [Cryptotermes secundus]
MMCEGHFSGSERLEVVEIHHHPQLLEQCCDILNMEWPRSKTVRLRSLMMSCDSLPTCLVLVQSSEVLGHSKLSPIPGLPLGCVIHSVVVHPEHRGKGLGKFLMAKTEECAKRDGSSSSERQTHQISRSAWGITNICYKGNYYNAGLHSHFYMYYCWNGSSILRDFEITVLKNMLWN